MDLSKWANTYPNIKVSYSNRKFYNKFYYKITYDIAYSYLVNFVRSDEDLKRYYLLRVAHKDDMINTILNKSQTEYLNKLRCLKNFVDKFKKQDGRVRTERSTISFFTNDLDSFYQYTINDMLDFDQKLTGLSVIANDAHKKLLDDNFLLLKTDIGYKFRVNMRSGNYSNVQNLKSLANYFIEIKDQIRIGDNLLSQLSTPYKYLQGGYFYVNDLRLVDIVRLIEPSLVRSIQKIAVQ